MLGLSNSKVACCSELAMFDDLTVQREVSQAKENQAVDDVRCLGSLSIENAKTDLAHPALRHI